MSVFQIQLLGFSGCTRAACTGSVPLHPVCGELSSQLERGTSEAKVRGQTSFGLIRRYCSLVMVYGPRLTQPSLKCLTQSHRELGVHS